MFPPVMRRGAVWVIGLSAFFVLASLAWVVLRGPMGVPRGWMHRYGSLSLVGVPFLVIWPAWWVRTRNIRRAIVESGGRLCPHCAYDVASLAPAGACPECGGHYDVVKDRAMWEAVGVRFDEGPTDRA